MKHFSSGVEHWIPYTQCFKYPTTASTSFSQPIQLNSGYGRTLKKMYVIFCNTSETFALAQDNSNIAGSKVQSFQSQLDSQLLQPYLVDCQTRFDDYELMKPNIKDCPIGQSRQTYQYNWFWMDDWSGAPAPGESKGGVPDDNIMGGVLLTQTNKVYTFTATTANAAYNVYFFAVFLKKIQFHSQVNGIGNIEIS